MSLISSYPCIDEARILKTRSRIRVVRVQLFIRPLTLSTHCMSVHTHTHTTHHTHIHTHTTHCVSVHTHTLHPLSSHTRIIRILIKQHLTPLPAYHSSQTAPHLPPFTIDAHAATVSLTLSPPPSQSPPRDRYRGTSLIRKRLPLGPCRRHMPRALW